MKLGGKAEALKKLSAAGFRIPRFFVCDEHWTDDRILDSVEKDLKGATHFAVRSSAHGEDSAEKSFAGQFHSAVAVPGAGVCDAVRAVVASFGRRDGSVIVQEFISSDRSGVAFSNIGDGLLLINANFGLCKTVVDGEPCDEFLLEADGSVIREVVAPDKRSLVFDGERLLERQSSDKSLDHRQIGKVTALAKQVEDFMGLPQDIEWCFEGDTLILLQARPITRKIPVPEEVYFDSANIAESYTGIVLPLTASFAEQVYRVVYTDFLRKSGVPRWQLKRHADVFAGLLAFHYGRMYYNMNNWYRMARFVPGYQKNKDNFELMISSNLRRETASNIKPRPALRVMYPFVLATKFLFFGATMRRFKRDASAQIHRYQREDLGKYSLQQCQDLYHQLENGLLRHWYKTIENDFLVMSFQGILKKLYPESISRGLLTFKAKGSEQISALQKFGAAVARNTAAVEAMRRDDVDEFLAAVDRAPELKAQYDGYLANFSGRFANELKLESVGIDEDLTKLFRVLRAYSAHVPAPGPQLPAPTIDLSFPKRLAFRFFLRLFKKYAAQREETRLLRSNMFSIVRRLFRRIGAIMVEQGKLADVDDVFYLTVEEVIAYSPGDPDKTLADVVTERRAIYREFAAKTPPAHFVTRSGELDLDRAAQPVTDGQLRGVSPGIAVGRIKVMREFSMPEDIDFEILVTSHTDPGWTALIALTKGLIIEHGGALSHAAIVARELGIPAVIGATGATALYHDGETVELDGTNGKIRRL